MKLVFLSPVQNICNLNATLKTTGKIIFAVLFFMSFYFWHSAKISS